MSRDARADELPEAVVAAIVALLAQLVVDDESDEQPVSAWARSGQVAPTWRGEGEWR